MPLLYTTVENHVQYMLEDATALPSSITMNEVINQAGRMFYSIHQWNFREVEPATIHLIKDQPYAELPPDFGELSAIEMTQGLNFGLTLVTPQELITRRATSITITQQYYWVAIITPRHRSLSGDWPQPRLELWPTPAADNLNAITVQYRIRWMSVPASSTPGTAGADDTYTIPLPEYAEMAYLEVVRAVAAGWGERLTQPQGGVTGMLKNVMGGAIWEAAVTTDGLQQMNYGPLSGGAIQGRYPLTTWLSAAAASANPA